MGRRRPSRKAEREELRRLLRAAGMCTDDMAAEFARRWGYPPMMAYRYVNELSLRAAAELYDRHSRLAARMDTGLLSRIERWPVAAGTRPPTAFQLMVLAQTYGAGSPTALLPPGATRLLPERDRRILETNASLPAAPPAGMVGESRCGATAPGSGPTAEPEPGSGGAATDPADLARRVNMAGHESREFGAKALAGEFGDRESLDHLRESIHRIAREYVHTERLPDLFTELLYLRDLALRLAQTGPRPLAQTRDVYLSAGLVLALLAHASNDLGNRWAAMNHARTAAILAEHAGHAGLRAWAFGQQAVISTWAGRTHEATQYAEQALAFAPPSTGRPRLAAVAARAHAILRDEERAREGIRRAEQARDEVRDGDDLDTIGGKLTFSRAWERYYVCDAYAHLHDADATEREATAAIELYESGSAEARSVTDVALSYVNIAHARVLKRDLDGAAEAIRPVLGLPLAQRVDPLRVSLDRLHDRLKGRRYAGSAAAKDVQRAIENFTAIPPLGEVT